MLHLLLTDFKLRRLLQGLILTNVSDHEHMRWTIRACKADQKANRCMHHHFFCNIHLVPENKQEFLSAYKFVRCRCASDISITHWWQIERKLNFRSMSNVGNPHLLRCATHSGRHALGEGT